MAVVRWGIETEITDTHWLWKPLIPLGKVTILEGDGGDGKTTLILTVAAGLSRGELPPTLRDGKLIPSDPVEPATTFYLTNEDEISDSSLRRFLRAGGDASRFAYSAESEHHVTLTEKELRQIIMETGARLVIIDPFQAFLPEGVSLGNITRMRAVFTMLSNVARSTGAAIVLVGHLNKSRGGKEIHRGFGSADIAAAVRSILLVERDRNRNRIVRAIKSNFDESDFSPIRLVFDDQRRLTFAEAEFIPGDTEENGETGEEKASGGKNTQIRRAEERIRDILASGPVPVVEMKRRMEEEKIGAKTAQRARKNLGAIQVFPGGVNCWQLPEESPPAAS